MELANRKWTEEEFLAIRREVLAQWHTGADVDLDEAVEFQKKAPAKKVFAKEIKRYKEIDEVYLLQVYDGRLPLENQISALQRIEQAGVSCSFLFPDTYTRRLQLEKAQRAIEMSEKEGKALLNGFSRILIMVSRAPEA